MTDTVSCKLPTLSTYGQFLQAVGKYFVTRPDCALWAQTVFESDLIFYFCMVAVVFYLIVLVIIYTTKGIRKSFRICAGLLAAADLTILIVSSREAVLQSCSLYLHEDLHMCRITFIVFTFDLRSFSICLMAVVRLSELFCYKRTVRIAAIGAIISLVITAISIVLSMTGNLDRICYKGNIYIELPMNDLLTLRSIMHVLCMVATMTIYMAFIMKMIQMKASTRNIPSMRQEIFVLVQSVFIFIAQLMLAYSTYWYSFKWNFTDSEGAQKTYLRFRPLCAASTPIIYVIFIGDVRDRFNIAKYTSRRRKLSDARKQCF